MFYVYNAAAARLVRASDSRNGGRTELSGPPNVKGLDERGCAGWGEWVILVLPLLRLEFFLDKKGF